MIAGSAWGIYRMKEDPNTGKITDSAEVLYGSLDGVEIVSR